MLFDSNIADPNIIILIGIVIPIIIVTWGFIKLILKINDKIIERKKKNATNSINRMERIR